MCRVAREREQTMVLAALRASVTIIGNPYPVGDLCFILNSLHTSSRDQRLGSMLAGLDLAASP